MLDKFISFIAEQNLVSQQHKLLLAVSGGIDSVVMMRLFHKAKYKADIAHCNFRLRNNESDEDEFFVIKTAERLNLKCHTKKFDTTNYSKLNGLSIQMAARELRYNWFHELAEKHNYDRIAIAHNRDDMVETFLINLSRGTGIKGLTGIKSRDKKIIRPLLFATRGDIEEYARLNNIDFREDSSNIDIKYQRNLIRHKIIPLFEKINPSFRETIIKESSIFSSTSSIYDQAVKNILKTITIREKPNHILSIQKIKSLRLGPEVLYDLLYKYGFTFDTVQNIHSACDEESGKLFYSENYVLLKDRNTLIIEAIQNSDIPSSYLVEKEIAQIDHPVKLKFSEGIRDEQFKISSSRKNISLDSDLLDFPLTLRRWEKGDYFYPLGMKNRKKLSDFFTDRKLTRLEKDKTWILASGEKILWIIGHQIDDRFKVTNKTTNLLYISLIE